MIEFLVLLFALFVTAPWMDPGPEYPNGTLNRCYLVNQRAEQIHGPCKPEESAGWQDSPSRRREAGR